MVARHDLSAAPVPAAQSRSGFPLFSGLRALAAIALVVYHAGPYTGAGFGEGPVTPYFARLSVGPSYLGWFGLGMLLPLTTVALEYRPTRWLARVKRHAWLGWPVATLAYLVIVGDKSEPGQGRRTQQPAQPSAGGLLHRCRKRHPDGDDPAQCVHGELCHRAWG
jgi:peptidoglycan/LPS O-acetylase OafA/YrhL